jgi:hypothetical protein
MRHILRRGLRRFFGRTTPSGNGDGSDENHNGDNEREGAARGSAGGDGGASRVSWPAGESAADESAAGDAVHMQVCAHADDDLYFMNPEVDQAIRHGEGIVSVYLTSGEADGKNVADNDPAREGTPVDLAGYVAARMSGLRAAYSFMADGRRDVPWERTVRPAPNGVQVEVATLTSRPDIRLVFVSLSAGRGAGAGTGGGTGDGAPAKRLCHLWTGSQQSQPTLPPTGSPASQAGEYGRRELIDLLVDLLHEYRPTVVRTLDPDPEHLRFDDDGVAEYSDHADHTAAAYFAFEALRVYRDQGGVGVMVRNHRGYYNGQWPLNLDAATYERKAALLDIYGGADAHECADPAGCGDFKVGAGNRTRRYGRSTATRLTEDTGWLRLMPDGRLAAFAVVDSVATQWIQQEPGGTAWQSQALDVADLMPGLSVSMEADGRIRLAGVRIRLRAKYDDQRREVVTAVQGEPGGGFGEWIGLSNPNYGNGWFRTHEIGLPECVVDASGHMQMLVRNFGMGLSARSERSPGVWSDWLDLGGKQLQGGLSAARLPDGTVEVFGNTRTGFTHLVQSDAHSRFEIDDDFTELAQGQPEPTGRPLLVADRDGGAALFFRQHQSESVSVLRRGSGGAWGRTPLMLADAGGFGGIAALPLKDARQKLFVIAVRDRTGRVSYTQTSLDGAHSGWVTGGGPVVGAPSIALDAAGRPVIAAIGTDARLYVHLVGDGDKVESWHRIG